MANIKTSDFRTKHEFFQKQNPKGKKDYIIGLDAGYSSMKVFYEGGYFCFPSFVKKVENEMLDLPDGKDLLYRDGRTGEMYRLGYAAQQMAGSGDTGNTDAELFARNRTKSRDFTILCQAAIGCALAGQKDNRPAFIETGLPSAYLKKDTAGLIKALSKPADFSLKIGTNGWETFKFCISPENINAIPQPAGGLYSAIIKNDGNYHPDAKQILYHNTLVIDIGFGTFDFYGIKNRELILPDTLTEIGMRKVMEKTSRAIFEKYGEDIPVASLQENLSTGMVTVFDDEGDFPTAKEYPIAGLLAKANDEVFADAIRHVVSMTGSLRGFDHLIVSGGTGAAWYGKIKEKFSGLPKLKIRPSNMGDPSVPLIYANARGYYMLRHMVEGRG